MNNENKGKFSSFMAGKGFYIVLFLCLTAIGISGYYLAGSFFGNDEAAITVAAPIQSESGTVSTPGTSPASQAMGDEPAVEAMADAEAAQAAAQAASQVRIWPLAGGVYKDYSVETLQYSVTTGDWRTHEGLDLMAYVGEPVMAITTGTVTQVYTDELYGTTVVISHDGSVTSKYSNLASVPTVTVGQTVAPGDVIGAVGESALIECCDDPHLHLEIYKEGLSMNPADYIQQ